jgi:hypothetical protein
MHLFLFSLRVVEKSGRLILTAFAHQNQLLTAIQP